MAPKRASLSDRAPSAERAPRASDTMLLGEERRRQQVEAIPLRDIMPNRQQPRTTFAEGSLEELAGSIREHGVVQPIVVRPIPLTPFEGAGRTYEIVAGERRWRASALAGKTTIPALVQTLDDRAALELAIIENLQREDLTPLDEARGLGRMHTELGYSYQQIADRLGKSKGYVQNRMELLDLPDDLKALVADRPDAMSHARLLAKVPIPEQRAALVAAVRDDALSLKETHEHVALLTEERVLAPVRSAEAGAPSTAPASAHTAAQMPNRSLRRLLRLAADLDAMAARADELAHEREAALAALDQAAATLAALRKTLLDPPF